MKVGLYIPENFPKDYKSNGCGPGWLSNVIPDNIIFLDVSKACDIHDFMYKKGKTLEDKDTADRVLLNNMLRIIETQTSWKLLKKWRSKLAYKYYDMVVKFGGPFYWWNKNPEHNVMEFDV